MRRPLKGLALGLVIGLLGSLATSLPRVSQIEEDFELNWLFHLRGPVKAPLEVVVVAIDEQSGQKLGLPSKRPLPSPTSSPPSPPSASLSSRRSWPPGLMRSTRLGAGRC